jgi:outer membrane immunogenic protein
MKKLATAIAAIALIGTPASAADMPVKAPPPAPAPVYSWTGFYLGGNFGGGWGSTGFSGTSSAFFPTIGVTTPSVGSSSQRTQGILGGGQVGFNYQFANRWVAGVEADIDGAGIKGSTSSCFTTTNGLGPAGCGITNTALNDFGTVRARLGYAWTNVLLYGTGGLAWGQNSTTRTSTCVGVMCPAASLPFTSSTPSTSSSSVGWAAGAGAEWAFLPNWSLRAEYLHLQFNNLGTSYVITGTTIGLPFITTTNANLNIGVDIVRVGLNYQFH